MQIMDCKLWILYDTPPESKSNLIQITAYNVIFGIAFHKVEINRI